MALPALVVFAVCREFFSTFHLWFLEATVFVYHEDHVFIALVRHNYASRYEVVIRMYSAPNPFPCQFAGLFMGAKSAFP